MSSSKYSLRAWIILILMGAQSLCMGISIHHLLEGNNDIAPVLFFSGLSIILFFYMYMKEMNKETEKIRSTEEIIDECWEKYEMEKASRRKKNGPRDQKPGS